MTKNSLHLLELPTTEYATYTVSRYPKTTNKSLRAWSAADEYLLSFTNNNSFINKNLLIYNDSFGFLTNHLNSRTTYIVTNLRSQATAIQKNLKNNKLSFNSNQFLSPLSKVESIIDLVIIKIPKSLDLFELYLNQLHQSINKKGTVACGFMTRHFSKQMLTIAAKYFDNIEQSKAWKKSRLLVLSQPKDIESIELIHEINFIPTSLKQYYGVFSAKTVDYATQFLIENIKLDKQPNKALDLASGNGVLALSVQEMYPLSEIHLVDDSLLAIESSKLNIEGENVNYHHTYNLDQFKNEEFDYIISNPPFHLEFEIDINLAIGLFKEAHRCLTTSGKFELVANRHLNYKTHLDKIFSNVVTLAENDKFIIYSCSK